MANPIQVVAGLLMVFFVPGYCLVNALFPRRNEFDAELDIVYRVTLGIGLSMALTILVSFGLNALGTNADTGLGYVDAPYIWASQLALSAALFAVGWWRGAYPWTARIHPRLARAPPPDPRSLDIRDRKGEQRVRLEELGRRRAKLMKSIREYERRVAMHVGERRERFAELKKQALEELAKLDEEMESLAGGEKVDG
jgi:hypothetical protein